MALTLAELAPRVGGEVQGDGRITGYFGRYPFSGQTGVEFFPPRFQGIDPHRERGDRQHGLT